MTEYNILKAAHPTTNGEVSEEWTWVATRPAPSSRAAIGGYLGNSNDEGTFVAIPARSWKPVTVTVETTLKFS